MKKVLFISSIALFFCLSGVAVAFVFGATNFSVLGYPDHSCYEPSPPYTNDEWAWRSFKNEAEQYRQCIEDYVEGAENDQRRIIEKANEAVDEYNRFVQSL